MNPAIRQWLRDSFSHRPCFICGLHLWCRHRESTVELATVQAESRAAERLRAASIEPARTPRPHKAPRKFRGPQLVDTFSGIHPNSILSVLVNRQLASTANKETPEDTKVR